MSAPGPQFVMRRPCEHCPFRTDATAIRFAARERAEEIEELAYRYGFPCHETADTHEDEDTGQGGYYFGEDSQHCVGHTIMRINEGGNPWPGIDNDEELACRLAEHVDLEAPVFASSDDFIEASA